MLNTLTGLSICFKNWLQSKDLLIAIYCPFTGGGLLVTTGLSIRRPIYLDLPLRDCEIGDRGHRPNVTKSNESLLTIRILTSMEIFLNCNFPIQVGLY